MKKLLILVCSAAASLLAADFWTAKPFTDWNEKDIQKMLLSSPWSKQFSVALAGGNGAASGRGRGGMGSTSPNSPLGEGPAGTADQSGLGRSANRNDPADGPGGMLPTINLIVRWQSAMPVREAIVKEKYGKEVATSADAKKALEKPIEHYIVSVGGVPREALPGDAEQIKKQMLAAGMLVIKGRDPIRPVDFMSEGEGRTSEVLFAFPKTAPITEDDKEVEFTVKIGDFSIRQKFRLKDMLVNGKLDL